MRRYETQKRSAILAGMVRELTNYTATADQKNAIRQLIFGEMWDEDVTQNLFKKSGHTTERLLEAAMSNRKDELIKLDQQIALRTKTLMQLQQSYEALVNRSILNERLKLQNALIKRDLQAIDAEEVKQLEPSEMTSPKQRAANKANALKATGPKSDGGKRRASVNATKHKLSLPIDARAFEAALRAIVALIRNDCDSDS